ncbi:hemerythrin domain-containing protein [Roseibium marinum]|uniref:Hemerythrin-like domain-containing protein n=1 Tax=Roseibium marinum TaxID=281252 RepID=A0A2S3UJJ2_9HYPH|nr:hemerythrin domain-containing protein [Roseibium marinum]POF27750.1 hemerythrin-like domain-containing protein [Roseibium marinum]
MTRGAARGWAAAGGETVRIGVLENPLDFLAEDHVREREVCALIDKLAAGSPVNDSERHMLLAFLNEQLPQHLADEDIDLFPLMLQRCAPDEEIDKVIHELLAGHGTTRLDAPAIAGLIEAGERELPAFSKKMRTRMTGFAHQARQDLIVENAIILPLARAHLTKNDLAKMKTHMLERRSSDVPPLCVYVPRQQP